MNKEENNDLWANARGRSESDMPQLTVDNVRQFCQRKAQLEWTFDMVGASPGELRELSLISTILEKAVDGGVFTEMYVKDIIAQYAIEYDPDKAEEFAVEDIDQWYKEQRQGK